MPTCAGGADTRRDQRGSRCTHDLQGNGEHAQTPCVVASARFDPPRQRLPVDAHVAAPPNRPM
eukprot:1222463-Pyramimonas_sp.AAC.1